MKMLKGCFEWFNINNFLDTHQEWHALVEGFADGFCPMRDRYDPSPELLKDLTGEHHYYNAGRAMGFGCFLVLLAGLIQWII